MKGLSLTFKEGTRQDYAIKKTQELKTRTWNVQDKRENGIYYVNICKMARLWCKIVRKTNVE